MVRFDENIHFFSCRFQNLMQELHLEHQTILCDVKELQKYSDYSDESPYGTSGPKAALRKTELGTLSAQICRKPVLATCGSSRSLNEVH